MKPEKINKIVAAVIFVIMGVIYMMTAAPTISFWDCGEFVTCSYIMGIPHPPGSPLLSLIGRVMSLIPFYDFRGYGFGEIAYRVTLIDVLLGALTVMLTYLILVKLIHKFRPYTGNMIDELVVMFSASITAFMVGFSDEFWTNAVEIETYMPGIFISMLTVWLTLRWDERKDDPKAVRYLFLAAYILGLGNGVHLTVLLIAPTIFLLVFLGKPKWFASSKLWIYGVIFLGFIGLIKIYGGLELLYFSMALFALIAPLIIYKLYMSGREVWKITLLGMILCFSLYIIWYSVYPTVAVRASKNPVINEGNPDNWERYKLYMARDQYGQENMYEGMFTRKAGFKYQFGYMYLRYLIQQFPKWGPSLKLTFENYRSPDARGENVIIQNDVYLAVFLLSILLYGLYTHGSKDWKRFISLILFFIASSIGLVLYLNMANPQVRERPYFFLGSYQIIMIWIGIGIFGIITDVLDWLRQKEMSSLIVPVTVLLFIVFGTMPPTAVLSNHIDPNFTNYEIHDRTGDWAPRDYGYNILVSCEKDAILFTNGDNDTFPLWYLQEVEGFRKDVRVVNLSLLNTDWYILQAKYEGENVASKSGLADSLKDVSIDSLDLSNNDTDKIQTSNERKTIPIRYSDDYIKNVLCGRDDEALRTRLWPVEGREVTAAGITWNLPPQILLNEKTGMLRIQDVMAANIIQWVNWERPIYFAVTVAEENKIGLEDYLSMEGMVYKLVNTRTKPGDIQVNVPVLDKNVFEKYHYHALSDPDVYKPPNTLKLVTNYFIGFAQLAERYATLGDKENTVRASWGAIKKTPNDLNKRLLLYQIFISRKFHEELNEFLDWETSLPEFTDGREGTLDERLRVCSFLNIIGKNEKADSLVQMEKNRLNLDSFESQYNFGMKLLQFSLNDQAYNFFEELTKENPTNVQMWEALAAAMFTTGRYDEALEAAAKILEIDPDDESAKQTRELIIKLIQEKNKSDSLELRQHEQ